MPPVQLLQTSTEGNKENARSVEQSEREREAEHKEPPEKHSVRPTRGEREEKHQCKNTNPPETHNGLETNVLVFTLKATGI